MAVRAHLPNTSWTYFRMNTLLGLSLVVAATAQKIDWWGICGETGDVDTSCPDLGRSTTFACLADYVETGGNQTVLADECFDAIATRGVQARESDKELWKTACGPEITSYCPDVEPDEGDVALFNCVVRNINGGGNVSIACNQALAIFQQQLRPTQQQQQQRQQQQLHQQAGASQAPCRDRPPVPIFSAHLRSAVHTDKCLSYPSPQEAGVLETCDTTKASQAWSMLTTKSGYQLMLGGVWCLAPDAMLVPCETQAKTFFALQRQGSGASQTTTVQDLFSGSCFTADVIDNVSLSGVCEAGLGVGWHLDPLYMDFVVKEVLVDPSKDPAQAYEKDANSSTAPMVTGEAPVMEEEPVSFANMVDGAAVGMDGNGKGRAKGSGNGKGNGSGGKADASVTTAGSP